MAAISKDLIKEGIRLGKASQERLGPILYHRFARAWQGVPEGTAVVGESVILGYPQIGRLMHLENGVAKHFANDFWVEEKIDGYNTRVFLEGDEILALTRRGYLCPFTMDRVPDFLPLSFFLAHPDLVLCAEVAGPGNPYLEGSVPFVPEDISFFVFDVMEKGSGRLFSVEEKEALFHSFMPALPLVPCHGKMGKDDIPALKALLRRLDGEGREGVVLKDAQHPQIRAKYVTERSCLSDIAHGAAAFLQLPPEYFTLRILRLVLFMAEEKMAEDEAMHRALGASLTSGIFSALKQIEERGRVTHMFCCRFRKEENALLFVETRKKLLGEASFRLHRLTPEREGGFCLEFEKEYPKMTEMLKSLLEGRLVFD